MTRAHRSLRSLLAVLLLAGALPAAGEDYLKLEDFLASAFPGAVPQPKTLWLTQESRQRAQQAIGIVPTSLRVRYWQAGSRTAWVLDEIGKERPITLGIVIEARRIVALRVMAFRESRGWEIRHAFFTTQFAGTGLDPDGRLDQPIDGITGATLSVRATDRAARLALWLDTESRQRVAGR